MASDQDFIEYICSQLGQLGYVRYRKMFGEYMIYVNEKPVILVCDNIPYINRYPVIEELMQDAEAAPPFQGADKWYILDVDHREQLVEVVRRVVQSRPYPDKVRRPAPCGAVCADCASFPAQCHGCREIKGKVFWLRYTGDRVCPIWQCCREKKRKNCGGCPELPCGRFMKDPSLSEEENARNLKRMLDNLSGKRKRK